MPQLDPTFYSSQLFWLAVTFITLLLLMWRVALPRVSDILATRQDRMEQDLERAEALKSEADEVMQAYEAELAESRSTAFEALKGVQEKAALEAAARTEEIETKLAAELADAEARIAASRSAALANISTIATDLASAAFEKLTGETADSGAIETAVEDAQGGSA